VPTDPFVHLHVASGYSLRHGASSPAALVERAAALGQDALALTDRDGLYGAVEFFEAATGAGIKPIIGCELSIDGPSTGEADTGSGTPREPARRT